MSTRKGSMQGPGAKLAALFSQDEQWKTSGNQSMKYNPAPLSSALSSVPETPSTEFLFTAAINLIQYDAAGTGTNLGARGMALLFQQASKSYHLVCYETATQKQDCSVMVNGNFKMSLLPGGHYCAFFDEKQQYWCTQLSSEEQVSSLAQAVACVNHAQLRQNTAEGASMPLIIQDLAPDPSPEAKPLANGDSVKIKYTMYLLSATHPKNPLGTIVGSVTQPKLVKLGALKELKGLEVGMLGMKKGQSRLLLIPPEQGYGSAPAGAIPANSTLLVLVTVTGVKYAGEKKSKADDEPAETSAPAAERRPSVVSAAPAPAPSMAPPANTNDEDNAALLKRIAQQSGGFSMAHLAGMKPTTAMPSPNIQQPTPSIMPSSQPLGPPASMFNPMAQYASPEQLLQMQQQQFQQQQQLLQQLGMFPGLGATGLSGLGIPSSVPPGVPGGVPGGFGSGLHGGAPAPPAGPSVSDQKQIGLLESMARRIDTIHASLSGSAELNEGLEGALSGYEVVRALQNSLKDRERTKAAMEANKKKMAQMQDKIDELRSASDTSRTETASSWEKRMEAFQEDAKQRQFLIADLTKEKKDLQATLMVKSQELSDVSFKLNLAQTDLERSKVSGGNIQELQKQAVDAKAELSSAKASLAALASEKASQLSELRASHATELASLAAQHQEALAALNTKLGGEVQTEQKKAGEASLALTATANLLQGQVSELTTKLQQQQAQVSDLTTQLTKQREKIDELTGQLTQQQQANDALRAKEEEERVARTTAQAELKAATEKLSSAPPPVAEDEAKARLKEEFEAGRAAGIQEAGEISSRAQVKEQETTHALLNGLKETIANMEEKLREAATEREDMVAQSKAVIKKLKDQLSHLKDTGGPETTLTELLQLLTQAVEPGETYEGAQILTLLKKAMRRVSNQIRAAMEAAPVTLASPSNADAISAQFHAPALAVEKAAAGLAVEKEAPEAAVEKAAPEAAVEIAAPELAVEKAAPEAAVEAPELAVEKAAPEAAVEVATAQSPPEPAAKDVSPGESDPTEAPEPQVGVQKPSEPAIESQASNQADVSPPIEGKEGDNSEIVAQDPVSITLKVVDAEGEGSSDGGALALQPANSLPESSPLESEEPGLEAVNIVLPSAAEGE